jgi:transposase-like protein
MARGPIADWAKLKLEYVQTRITIAELAEKHGLKPETVKKQAERHRWGMERLKFEQIALAEAAEAASKERITELLQFNRDDLRVAKAIRARCARRLAVVGEDIPASELRLIASAAEAAQRIGRLALGATTENVGHPGFPTPDQGVGDGAEVSTADYLKARARAIEDF